jgi:tetratricopeptide (TPR) repeat protein
MKKSHLYVIGACVLVLGVIGCCTGQSCMKKKKIVPAPVVEAAKVPAQEVVVPVTAVVEAPVAAPVVAAAPVVEAAVVPAVVAAAAPGASPNFGDYKSSTLTTKAWQALAQKDTAAVLVYTNKCVDMYGPAAVKMQAELKDYPSGDPQKVFSYWAVNDIATSLYIQGEAYRKAKELDKAKAAYTRVVNEFSYGQAYDPASQTFWKPAEAARDALYMIEKGLDLDYGNMTSNTLAQRMWESLAKNNLDEVIAYNMKLGNLYSGVAKDMQRTLKDYPQLPAENIHTFWALNDVGTGEFILGEAYRAAGKNVEAIAAYKKVITDYLYAQCWDTNGWFWKPAEAAQQKIMELEVAVETKK